MTLSGQITPAPPGVHGFDCNTKLSKSSARKLKKAGFTFAIRYLKRKATPAARDLDTGEAEIILDGGLALMAVQHVAGAPWKPSKEKGTTYGTRAVEHARAIGLPAGINLFLDLEGVSSATSAEVVVDYCNAWFKEVANAGYVAAIYVGANCGLTADQLYWRLRTQHYWKSGSDVPPIPERGYCLVQRIMPGDVVGGVEIDRNVTRTDAFGNTPLWLTRVSSNSG